MVQYKIDFFYDPKKKKYGIYSVSTHYETGDEFFKSRKSAKKRAKELQKLGNKIAKWFDKKK